MYEASMLNFVAVTSKSYPAGSKNIYVVDSSVRIDPRNLIASK